MKTLFATFQGLRGRVVVRLDQICLMRPNPEDDGQTIVVMTNGQEIVLRQNPDQLIGIFEQAVGGDLAELDRTIDPPPDIHHHLGWHGPDGMIEGRPDAAA